MTHSPGPANDERRLDAAAPYASLGAGVIGLGGLAVGVLAGWQSGWEVFFRSYLLNYCFFVSLALGALFFVLLHHLTRAGWSVSVRRLAEFVAATLPLLAVLFLPLLVPVVLGLEGVWEWTNKAAVAQDELLQHKQAYLNMPFFIVRVALCLVLWIWMARYYLKRSVEQDTTGDPNLTFRMQWWSGPAMLVYALTATVFAVDLLMSLNPHWYSTIFPVYVWSGSVVGFFALLGLLVYAIQRTGRLTRSVTIEHYHDIGKLAFGFVVFWAYIAYSQYMLMWYANVPEETVWYLPRQGDGWWIGVSLMLLFGHFLAPFLALLSRYPKRRPGLLVAGCVWLLMMHWLDLYYLVAPHPRGAGPTTPRCIPPTACC